jgi:hypothetical protein
MPEQKMSLREGVLTGDRKYNVPPRDPKPEVCIALPREAIRTAGESVIVNKAVR